MSEIRMLSMFYTPGGERGRHGPWSNTATEAQIAALIEVGFVILGTSTTVRNADWVRAVGINQRVRLVHVSTLWRA